MTNLNRKMPKCFMNGKSCIYERTIHDTVEDLNSQKDKTSESEKKAFMIMPFDKKLQALYQWEVVPFLKNGGKDKGDDLYKCTPERADDVRQTGYVICEKICKKIQEAHLIVVDLSFDNPNVYYEFGLSVALKKRILPICVKDNLDKRKNEMISSLGFDKIMPYKKFDILEERIEDYIFELEKFDEFDKDLQGNSIRILNIDNIVEFSKNDITPVFPKVENFQYEFGPLYKTAVGNAINSIFSTENKAKNKDLNLYTEFQVKDEILKVESINLPKAKFENIKSALNGCGCILIDITDNININYFWLGFLHGIGSNVIPINRLSKERKSEVPFDIRALWHIIFHEEEPLQLSSSLQDILEFIYIEKAKDLNRRKFWNHILQATEVSVFLGSVYLENLERNTIGDWDYRTAAEITKYLSSSKETIKVTLESPLPKRTQVPDERYINGLKEMLKRNSIIVASSDVNDLTEVALSGIFKRDPFMKISKDDLKFKGYIAYKAYSKPTSIFPEMAFYRRIEGSKEDKRGYILKEGRDEKLYDMPHLYPSISKDSVVKDLLGQLVVARNPFIDGKWIIIVSGISGPSTFGIAQMLTGAVYPEFTINKLNRKNSNFKSIQLLINEYIKTNPSLESYYKADDSTISYDSLSESMLKLLSENASKDGEINALINVGVYYPSKDDTSYSNDDRKIIAWSYSNLTEFLGKEWQNPSNLNLK